MRNQSLNGVNSKVTEQRLYNHIPRPWYTPSALSHLSPDEVFVFGSNLQGYHGGGAARAAVKKFGAVWGQGVGLQGQSYAIPTMQGGVATIKPYVDQFIAFAREHGELFFYVTRIGCGIAGFRDCDIAPLFKEALTVGNICLPESFVKEIADSATRNVPQELMTMMYGQVRTLIDLLKELNNASPINSAVDAVSRLTELVERNVRYGDEFAFMALRTIWSLMARQEQSGANVDIEQLEKDMISYHKGGESVVPDTIAKIFYNYSVRKMIKYIQFLNEFRRYKSYEQIREDLSSISFSHCGENDPHYYFSFSDYTKHQIWDIFMNEWGSLSKNGTLDNDQLEQIVCGRFDQMVRAYGLRETIRLAYGDVGCHPDIQGPVRRKDGTVWGPIYRIEGNYIEKGCSDFRQWPWSDTGFEMHFACKLLDKDKNYRFYEDSWGGGVYIPVSDHFLPVYMQHGGKLYFETQEEKEKFILEKMQG